MTFITTPWRNIHFSLPGSGSTRLARLLSFFWRRQLLSTRDRVALPPPELRAAGPLFRSDRTFRNFAASDVALMERYVALSGRSILDFGCGVGRLYYGLTSRSEPSYYLGTDIRADLIAWAQRHIATANSRFTFRQVDIQHDRYNPSGAFNNDAWRTVIARPFDIIYCYSVFSHLGEDDAKSVFSIFSEHLPVGGWLFLTAFVGEQAEDVLINPTDAGLLIKGPLHIVRYRKDYFRSLLSAFDIVAEHADVATDGQTFFVARRR